MAPEKRLLLRVCLPDPRNEEEQHECQATEDLVEQLMGSHPELRFQYIQEHAKFVDDLDIWFRKESRLTDKAAFFLFLCVSLKKNLKKDIDSIKKRSIFAFVLSALVAELVDAADSKSVVLTDVLVRFRPGAPLKNLPLTGGFLLLFSKQ